MRMYQEHDCCKEEKGTVRLYKIGMFAAMNHVSIKTLRYYDEQGLLKPTYVDEINGYRYYIVSQIADLHQILALKNMGFSLDDIRAILKGKSEKELLIAKKQEILRELAQLTAKLAQVESYLNEENLDLSAPVLVKKIPEVIVAAMTERIDTYDALFEVIPKMGEEMERLGCKCAEPNYCFTHYLEEGYKDEQILVEVCEAVAAVKDDSEVMQFKVLPEIKEAACIFHKGSYDTFPKSYEKLLKFIEENEYEICGNVRESYIDGVWNKESVEEWLTEIQIPVCKRGEKEYA